MRNRLQLYHKFLHQVCQWLPEERITRKRNLALLVVGVYLSRAVHLSLIARTWPIEAKIPSLVNRLHRFLNNPHFVPQRYYRPLVEQLVKVLARERMYLVIDTTKVGLHYRALVIGLAYRRRTLPLAWSLHRGSRGNVATTKIITLLEEVRRMLPYDCAVYIAGDSGFRTGDLLFWFREHEWHFVVRQPGNSMVRQPDNDWISLADFPLRPGQTWTIGWVWLAVTNPFGPFWLVLHWAEGEDEPWFLVADQPGEKDIIRLYKKRVWIEEMYGDMKGHGFDLESTHLRDERRIERLMLAVCIAFVWLITLGSWVVKNSFRHLIDHKSRRDKSYFRLGWDWVERSLSLGLPVRLHFRPYL